MVHCIAHASHQCCPGSVPGLEAICGLSLFLVLLKLKKKKPYL